MGGIAVYRECLVSGKQVHEGLGFDLGFAQLKGRVAVYEQGGT
jgi:hypothetical protein